MENVTYNGRLNKVFQLLIEISRGNFSYRLERTDKRDELEALTAIVNIVAEEIKDSFLHQGYVNMHDSYMHLVQMIFFLDKNFNISYTNQDVTQLLHWESKELLDLPLVNLLEKESVIKWMDYKKSLSSDQDFDSNLRLVFKTKVNLQFPAYCKIVELPEEKYPKARYMLLSSDIIKNTKLQERKLQSKILKQIRFPRAKHSLVEKSFLSVSDLETFRAIGTYLKNNLDKNAPSLQELAHEFGTNEYKLKKGFKELFGMTVFQFLKNERLRNAHVLVKSSNEPFKRIARQNGFKNATHFSREFKARYGYTPRDLRLNS
ncbi:MAG: helix-turn-helix transcriptional regulator [Arenibacter algicola]